MTPATCDACDKGAALHNAWTPHGEGSFCCKCAHCVDPIACLADWQADREDARDAAAEARADR